jgi:hypothetical protein
MESRDEGLSLWSGAEGWLNAEVDQGFGLDNTLGVAGGLGIHLSLDYQRINNPAYNRDRGPVSIFAVRVHAQY